MTAALYVLYGLGLAAAVAFLVLYWPRQWYSVPSLNATGWIWIVAVVFVRSLVLLVLRGGPNPPPRGDLDTGISLGSLAAVDALVWLRLVSYLRYLRRDRR